MDKSSDDAEKNNDNENMECEEEVESESTEPVEFVSPLIASESGSTESSEDKSKSNEVTPSSGFCAQAQIPAAACGESSAVTPEGNKCMESSFGNYRDTADHSDSEESSLSIISVSSGETDVCDFPKLRRRRTLSPTNANQDTAIDLTVEKFRKGLYLEDHICHRSFDRRKLFRCSFNDAISSFYPRRHRWIHSEDSQNPLSRSSHGGMFHLLGSRATLGSRAPHPEQHKSSYNDNEGINEPVKPLDLTSHQRENDSTEVPGTSGFNHQKINGKTSTTLDDLDSDGDSPLKHRDVFGFDEWEEMSNELILPGASNPEVCNTDLSVDRDAAGSSCSTSQSEHGSLQIVGDSIMSNDSFSDSDELVNISKRKKRPTKRKEAGCESSDNSLPEKYTPKKRRKQLHEEDSTDSSNTSEVCKRHCDSSTSSTDSAVREGQKEVSSGVAISEVLLPDNNTRKRPMSSGEIAEFEHLDEGNNYKKIKRSKSDENLPR